MSQDVEKLRCQIAQVSLYFIFQVLSWLWSYGSWIYNYLCNQCLSPLMLWVWISIRARCATLCDKFCQWLVTGQWFSWSPPVFSTNKTDCHDMTEVLLKVALNTIKQTNRQLLLLLQIVFVSSATVSNMTIVLLIYTSLTVVSHVNIDWLEISVESAKKNWSPVLISVLFNLIYFSLLEIWSVEISGISKWV